MRNTVDNPFTPRAGSRYTAGFQFVGGPLQGSVNYMRPTIELVRYQPFGRRMALGVRGEAAYIRPFGDTTTIPYYQRYFLGGETQIRGFNVRSVAPYDAVTKTSVGGDKFLLFNAEYYFDVFGPLRLLLFFDAGQAYAPGQGFYWKTMSTSTGVEARFIMPVLNVPFRLIYAWNPNRDFLPAAARLQVRGRLDLLSPQGEDPYEKSRFDVPVARRRHLPHRLQLADHVHRRARRDADREPRPRDAQAARPACSTR